jgi:hypothetical protein
MKRSLASLVFMSWLASPALASENPWELLNELRAKLVTDGPMTARFEQTYIPSGFSTGDFEKGHVSIWLPDCLRWNYAEPQVKSFLLCKNEIWAWNDEEEGGRHYKIEPEKEPGLDLLLVDVARLKERYSAETRRLASERVEISLRVGLAPAHPQPGKSKSAFSAKIELDTTISRVLALEYTDEEGNLTRFRLVDYQPLAHKALFQPPQDIQWTVE